MAHKLDHILDRFRELGAEIQKAALQDARFRALCEDYGEAVEAFKFWSASPDARAPKMIDEYRKLLAELEVEIFEEIQKRS